MIDHVYLDLFNQGSTVKNISISYEESPDVIKYITNDDIVINTFSLNESAFSGNELKFGSLVSSKMSFKIFNKRVSDALIDKELNVKEFINYDTNNPFVFGKYRVKTEKSTADKLYRQIEAYDFLYDIVNKDVSAWYESLTFPLSQKEFRDSFFSYIGIEQVQTTLVNDNMVVTKTISATELPGKIVLSAICEINGAIGRINRDGKFAYVILDVNPSERITLNKIVSGSGSYEDYDTTAISKVQIRNNENDIGAIVGEDGNTYVVQDNFLVYGKSSTDLTNIANNLLSVISGISYRPFNAKFIYGNPCYEIGDAITVVSRNATFNSYIFNRTLNGINAITDTINAKGTQIYSNNINSKNNQILQLENRTNELVRTVDGMEARVTESVIKQIGDEGAIKSVTIQYYLSDSTQELTGGEWSDIAPDWISEKYMWQRTKITDINNVVYYSPSENGVCIAGAAGAKGEDGTDGVGIKSVTPLYYCKSSTTKPSKPTEKVTQTGDVKDAWSLTPATWTETYKYYYTCSQIEYSNGTYTWSDVVDDKALSKSITEIAVNANGISQKVSKNNIISSINQSAESISINADKINLNGTVTANENFKILEDGSMECKSANITGGIINVVTGLEEQRQVLTTRTTPDSDGYYFKTTLSQGNITSAYINKDSSVYDKATGFNVLNSHEGSSLVAVSTSISESEIMTAGLSASNEINNSSVSLVLYGGKNSSNIRAVLRQNGSVGIVARNATENVFMVGDTGVVAKAVKTSSGANLDTVKTKLDTVNADLDTVKAKADGSLKSTYVLHATGTSSAFPSVDISSIPNDTMMRIEVGIPIDNATTQTMAWFSTTVKKSSSTADYLYNCGGYYYSANYNASVFISVSNSRVTINNAWTKVIGGSNAAEVNNLKSKSTIYVYTENL